MKAWTRGWNPGGSHQLAFEIEAALLLGNAQFVVTWSTEPIERARRAIEHRPSAVVVDDST